MHIGFLGRGVPIGLSLVLRTSRGPPGPQNRGAVPLTIYLKSRLCMIICFIGNWFFLWKNDVRGDGGGWGSC